MMEAASKAYAISFFIVIAAAGGAVASPPVCDVRPPDTWLDKLQSICAVYDYESLYSPPIQVDGDFFDRLVDKRGSPCISVLFHASWCPFSRDTHPIFETLSFMFPEIEHLTIEQSSVMPSLLSRYGIHSFPAILIVNQSSSVLYSGSQDLSLLVQFYKKSTGAEPVQYMSKKHPRSLTASVNSDVSLLLRDTSVKGILTSDPYLAFSVLFVFMRLVHYIIPGILACANSLRQRLVVPQMSLEIFREMSQLFYRARNMIDVKRFWTKLKMCKTRNFHQRARSARIWASSLASVSVGEN